MFLAFSLWDIIRVPFGWLIEQLYQFTANYGVALILFSLIVKLILLPASAKSKKSMMKMSRYTPLIQALQKKYQNDPQKLNQEMRRLQTEEGVSMGGGCLWSLLPMLMLFPLYTVIRQPLIYMLHLSAEQAASVVEVIKAQLPDLFTSANQFYNQLIAAPHLSEFAAEIQAAVPGIRELSSINFQFLGIDLGAIPSWKIWTWSSFSWANLGLFLLPLLSAASNVVSMFISQKMNSSVVTDENGNRDEAAAAQANASAKSMMWISPIMTLLIGYGLPGALSLYWLVQGLFTGVQDVILTKRYRKLYDEEDAVKQRVAALKAEEEAEKERIRAQRRAENPDGIVQNTSKKKLQNMQNHQKNQSQPAQEAENDTLSGIPDRPFARGRAYRPDHYQSSDQIEE